MLNCCGNKVSTSGDTTYLTNLSMSHYRHNAIAIFFKPNTYMSYICNQNLHGFSPGTAYNLIVKFHKMTLLDWNQSTSFLF